MIQRLGGLFNKPHRDRELDDEIESHLQMHIEDNLRTGMLPEEARRQAMIKLGGVESMKESYRDQRGLPWLETLWYDLRYSARQLRKHPGFTAVALFTLALSIGANTSLFTAIDRVMFRPLPVPKASRLVFLANGKEETFSFPFYERLREGVSSLAGCAAAQYRVQPRECIAGDSKGEAEVVSGQGVTGNFFAVLDVAPILGRTFVEEDDRRGAAEPVVVISHALWRRRFSSDPAIIGRKIQLDNVPVTIVGVMPSGFIGFQTDVGPDVWWPLQLVSQMQPLGHSPLGEGVSWLVLFGRLPDGTSPEQVQAEVTVFFRRQLEDEIAQNPNRPAPERERILSQSLELRPGRAGYVSGRSEFRQPLLVLMAAVGVVLLIASVNIAGLLLARGKAREREFSVRASLGAGRSRIVRQLVTESLLLALMGGALGFLFARGGTAFLANFLSQSGSPLSFAPDNRALSFTIAASLITAAIFGLAPAWRLSRLDLVTAMKHQGTAVAGPSRARLQPLLVIGQVALSVLLLAFASLFARTLNKLRTLDFGFHTEHLITFSVDPGRWRPNPLQSETLQRRLLAELQTLPGIQAASIGGAGLLTGNGISMDVDVEDYTPAPGEEMRTWAILAGPQFFPTMRVPLLCGREFTRADEPPVTPENKGQHATVAIIGEAMAHRFFGTANPVGRHFTVNSEPKVRLEIVGVAKDTRYSRNLRNSIPLQFYIPYFGSGIRMPATFYLRADRDSAAFASGIQRIIARVEPRLKIRELHPMSEIIDRLLLRERIIAELGGFFSAFALLLTGLGLYGILAFQVAQRTRDIGVRMALGATRRSVLAQITRQGLGLVACGTIIGIGSALIATRFVASLLYGITPADPISYLAVTALLLSVSFLAGWFPARRAANIDPMVALRCE
ncbi:MAG TPA: ABC transporter permease [Candidatus Limnocylindrales bacterium]|nr:ABC transporter permease [Candidatus Limnocylindrales bacterium]